MYYVLLAHFQKISLPIIGIINYPSCTCYFEHTYSLQLRIQLAFFAWKNTRGLSYKWDFARDSSEEKNLSRGRVDARGEGKTRGGEIRKKKEERDATNHRVNTCTTDATLEPVRYPSILGCSIYRRCAATIRSRRCFTFRWGWRFLAHFFIFFLS